MTNYNDFTIFGWMINELNLSGSDLIVYAYFYDLSKNRSLLVTDVDVINATDCLRRVLVAFYNFDAYDLDYAITKLMATNGAAASLVSGFVSALTSSSDISFAVSVSVTGTVVSVSDS